MNKKILYVLAAFGLVFVYYLFRAMWGGFSSTVAPNSQIQKAKCIADCRNNKLSSSCEQYCIDKTIGQ